MAKKKSSRGAKTKLATRTSVATFVGVGLLTASAAAAAFGFASFSMSAMRPRVVTIRANTATPASDILIAGQTNVELARFDVTAGAEAITIDSFAFTNCIARTNTDGDCSDRGEVGANFTSMLSAMTVTYQDSTGATVSSSASPIADAVTFVGQTLYVPARTTRTIVVYGDLAPIDDAGLFSGDRLQVNFNATSGNPFSTWHLTTASGRTFDQTQINQNTWANAMVIRKTEPTFSLSSSSPDGSAPPDMEVLRFNVAAASEGDIALERITFTGIKAKTGA